MLSQECLYAFRYLVSLSRENASRVSLIYFVIYGHLIITLEIFDLRGHIEKYSFVLTKATFL